MNCSRQMGAETVIMPLLKYFGWMGSFPVAALFAANWCSSMPIARSRPSDVPLNQRINIRIHTDHKWPERAVFDTTRSMPTPAVARGMRRMQPTVLRVNCTRSVRS
jgi:hypothetical protein